MPDNIINFDAWRDASSACEATDLLRQVLSNARAGCTEGELPPQCVTCSGGLLIRRTNGRAINGDLAASRPL